MIVTAPEEDDLMWVRYCPFHQAHLLRRRPVPWACHRGYPRLLGGVRRVHGVNVVKNLTIGAVVRVERGSALAEPGSCQKKTTRRIRIEMRYKDFFMVATGPLKKRSTSSMRNRQEEVLVELYVVFNIQRCVTLLVKLL